VEFLIAAHKLSHFFCECEAGYGTGYPEWRVFPVFEEFFDFGSAVFRVYIGTYGEGVQVDDAFIQQGVEVGFNRGLSVGFQIVPAGV